MGMKAEQWRQIILSFESKKTYNNPFLDVSIRSVFTGPSGRRIRREAYWDGGNTYRIAFAPTETGMWSYRLEAPEETGLSGVQGTIECIPYEGNLAIYQHGFLKVHPSGRYLTYADGTPFFWLGDTHWAFAFGERWDESNHPQMTSMFRGMADRRKEQGYNVYQTNLRSDSWKEHKSRYWKTDAADDVPDVAFYQNELDRRMQYLADLGFINALGFAWSGSIEQGVEHQKHLARYIIARYGALPVVWTLAGEVAGYFPGKPRETAIKGWREVAKYKFYGRGGFSVKNVLDTITSYREARHWSNYDLASHAGIKPTTISTWYSKNIMPTLPTLVKVCDAFGITLTEFFSVVESGEREPVVLTHEHIVFYQKFKSFSVTYT